MRLIFSIFILILWGWLAFSGPAHAQDVKRYASIVVDADTLDIIHARQIDEQRYPASLTKVMTLYLTFDAINRGELRLQERLVVSPIAAKTPPFGLGLTAGQSITVNEAIQAVAVRSANDAAVVLAERLAGSEEMFAHQMNAKAAELGMISTTFKTANGLPHPEQKTTARDMAKLSLAVLQNHKRYYHYFGQKYFDWKGSTKKNTNGLLHWVSGVDGFKTGYTRASGYNLIISARRDGRRIIAVVLGGASGKSRNTHMKDLVERGFRTLGVAEVTSLPPVTVAKVKKPIKPKAEVVPAAVRLRGSDGETVTLVSGADIKLPKAGPNWAVQVGTFSLAGQARVHLEALARGQAPELKDAKPLVAPVTSGGRDLFRARFTGLTSGNAHAICRKFKDMATGCRVISPSG